MSCNEKKICRFFAYLSLFTYILDEKRSKHDRFTQPSDFGPAFWQRMLRLAQGTIKYNTSASNIGLIKFDITIVARILISD
jgi:hypothetical protein